MIAGIMSPIGDLPPSTRFLTIEQVSLVMSVPTGLELMTCTSATWTRPLQRDRRRSDDGPALFDAAGCGRDLEHLGQPDLCLGAQWRPEGHPDRRAKSMASQARGVHRRGVSEDGGEPVRAAHHVAQL